MADTILSRLSVNLKSSASGAKAGLMEGMRGNPAGGIVGSVFKGAVGGLLLLGSNADKQGEQQSTKVSAKASGEVSAHLSELVPFFANIAENVQMIAHHIGASITIMKDMKEDAETAKKRAAVAKEEAATEDAIPAPPGSDVDPNKQVADLVREENKKAEEDEKAGGFLKQFGGLDFEGIVGSMGSFIGEALFDLGFTVITKLFPVGLIVSLVAAVGYGVYKYFTDEEFKKTVDDAFSTAKQFVIENVFDPFISGVKKLVTGAVEFLGSFWETIKGLISKAWNYVSDKASSAGKAVVSGVKSFGSAVKSLDKKIGSFFGLGGEKKQPEPAGQSPVSSAAKPPEAKPVAPASEVAPPAGGGSKAPAPATAPDTGGAAAPPPSDATATGAATGDASKLESVVNKASGVDLSGIVPALKARIAGFAAEFQQITGKKILITSGFRSPEKQKELYAKDPKHAAKPGVSPHEVGTAFDANSKSGDLDKAEQLGLFAKYKLFRPLWPPHRTSGVMEAWHVEPLERKKIASAGDGGIVAGSSGSAVDPGNGKATPVPPAPDKGAAIGAASVKNAAINEQRERERGGTNVTIVNAQQNVNTTVEYNPTIVNTREEKRAFS